METGRNINAFNPKNDERKVLVFSQSIVELNVTHCIGEIVFIAWKLQGEILRHKSYSSMLWKTFVDWSEEKVLIFGKTNFCFFKMVTPPMCCLVRGFPSSTEILCLTETKHYWFEPVCYFGPRSHDSPEFHENGDFKSSKI